MLKWYEKIRFMHRATRYVLRTEKDELAIVRSLISPGDVAVDIGAHKGVFTYWMAKQVGTSGRILAFEPIPFLAAYLEDVTHWLKKYDITLHRCALSDRAGNDTLFFPGEHLGSASLEKTDTVMRDPINVAKITLDQAVEKANCDRPISFIKCDVENHELAVFQGARKTLTEHKPMLLFESGNLDDGRQYCDPTFEFLFQLGYEGTFIDRGTLVDLHDYDASRHKAPTGENQNFLFLHPASHRLVNRTFPYQVACGALQKAA